jgi:hypothetical protein
MRDKDSTLEPDKLYLEAGQLLRLQKILNRLNDLLTNPDKLSLSYTLRTSLQDLSQDLSSASKTKSILSELSALLQNGFFEKKEHSVYLLNQLRALYSFNNLKFKTKDF